MAAGLPRFGVVMSVLGSVSGERAGQLKPGHFPLPALPPRAEVRAAAAESIMLAVACLISYWLTTRVLSLVYSVSEDDDVLGGMWAVIATVFLFRDSYTKSMAAAVSRMAATLVSFVLCLAYLAFLPFHPWGLAILVGLSVLVTALIGRPEDEVTAGITTTAGGHRDRCRRGPGGRVAWPARCPPPNPAAGFIVMSAARLVGGLGLALSPDKQPDRT